MQKLLVGSSSYQARQPPSYTECVENMVKSCSMYSLPCRAEADAYQMSPPPEVQLAEKWDRLAELTTKRLAYGLLAGGLAAVLLARGPGARTAITAFAAGTGCGSAWQQVSKEVLPLPQMSWLTDMGQPAGVHAWALLYLGPAGWLLWLAWWLLCMHIPNIPTQIQVDMLESVVTHVSLPAAHRPFSFGEGHTNVRRVSRRP
ncbi:uncharacterized protein HaLaN_08790 [Haematococcus lacustris]|uniref:Uncharacterized protein n=1 Tax=Haematococcus lacustris TaxID=44745 RepID=A0A699Z1U6_HAELA|nr:uncharacterized protein HaLaN_08790 [Haematococcus lacustris]